MPFQSLGLSSQMETKSYLKKKVSQQIPKSIYLAGFSEEAGQDLVVVPVSADPRHGGNFWVQPLVTLRWEK